MTLSRAWHRALLRPSSCATPSSIRCMHSSRIARAAQSSHHEEEEHYPSEGFNSPIWRNTLLLAIASAGIYRFSITHADPHPARSSSSGRSAPGNESEDDTNDDDNRPFLTRYIDYYSTPAQFWKERNERHLDFVREKAEERLLFQDAERPPVHRLRYANTFEQASPHCLAVGAQADLSDLKVKRGSE
ncbi:hypothetical protein CBS101457_000521 [Exobasidium rhododendri]|nr:hypothetical protein CBS101457_000521 [Exobasidium rhododendri]